jgi:hypothetical protein
MSYLGSKLTMAALSVPRYPNLTESDVSCRLGRVLKYRRLALLKDDRFRLSQFDDRHARTLIAAVSVCITSTYGYTNRI